MLQLALLWLPLAVSFGVILWIQAKSLERLQRQRQLDRCLLSVLQPRCERLSRISEMNGRLVRIARAILKMKAAKTVASVIPGAQGAAVAGEALERAARVTALAIARYQSLIAAVESAAGAAALRCGRPDSLQSLAMKFQRTATWESTAAEVPAPLDWLDPMKLGRILVRTWDGRIVAYGHCAPESQLDMTTIGAKGRKNFRGEHFSVSFREPARGIFAGDRHPWKRWPSLPLPR